MPSKLDALAFAITAGAVLAAGCGPREDAKAGTLGTASTDERPECPHDIVSGRHVTSDMLLSGPISNVPEFHDCQRLLESPGDSTYGPLVGVYVSWQLHNVQWPGKADTVVRIGGVPVEVPGGYGVPVAEILKWDGAPYGALGIVGEYQCLYLLSETQAAVVGVTMGRACREPLPPLATLPAGTPVELLTIRKHDAAEPPPVGRWDHDGTGHFISIACPGGWCEIGPAVFSTSRDYAGYDVKPWYDEQRLAVLQGDELRPGTAYGTAIPVTDLASTNITGKMAQVGSLAIHGPSPAYLAKLGFHDRPVGTNMASLWLCEGSADDCEVPEALRSELACADGFWAKIRAPRDGLLGPVLDWLAGVPTQYHCVIYRDHPEIENIPATLRWRWRKDDEGIWARCKSGCCELT
jgi:hypothetical protein